MKKITFVSMLVLSAAVLCGAESSYNYLKAFFNPYPKDPAVKLQSKLNGSNRVLTFTVSV